MVKFFGGSKPLVWKPRFCGLTAVGFHPLFIAGPRPEIIDDVEEAKLVREKEHNFVTFFDHSKFVSSGGDPVQEVFPHQVQIIAPGVETENEHLVAPFSDFEPLHFRENGEASSMNSFRTSS